MVIGIGRSEDNGTRTTFEASTTADVLSTVERLAKAHSEACQASVHLIEGRKPSGFDAPRAVCTTASTAPKPNRR
jgi:hypothetical protein